MKAVITIQDVEDKVNINVDFGKGGLNEESFAHKVALFAVEKISEALKDDD